MKLIFSYLSPYKGRMALGLLIKTTATLSELLLPFILSHVLKNVVASADVTKIIMWGVLMIACALVACFMHITANRMAARVSRDFSIRMRRDLFSKTLRLGAENTDRLTVPSLEARITSDTYNVHNFISMMQRMGVRAPMLLLGGITITLIMDSFLALVMIAMLPIIFCIIYFISRKGVPLYTKVQKSVDRMVRVVREDAQGIRVIKALSKNDYENRRYDEVNRTLSKDEAYAGTVMGIVNPVMTLLMNVGITAVVALSASRVANHSSDPETVIAFMQYFTLISMAMMTLSRIFVMYTKCAASARRISEVINTPDPYFVTEPKANGKEHESNTEAAHIEFDSVSFSYLGKHNNLSDISFRLRRGESLGIIGATGSGKSTLVKLLMRFYEPSEGRILIDGKEITSYEKDALTAMFGSAMQNDFLYADTIEENIKFGREISHGDVERAARIAQAEEFILNIADGYSHMLSPKGTNLSGGQRQRLLISRALASKPEILILDDSSSALDYKTDAALRRALRENLADTTVITVAQRVSSVKDCDLILVLEEGRVIGCGVHEELLHVCPEYKEISDSQMGGAFVE